MAQAADRARLRDSTTFWLALVEVKKPRHGILFAEEVEGAYAWAAAEARSRSEASTMIRRLFAGHGLTFGRFESIFEAAIEEISGYDRLLADQLSQAEPGERCARGSLAFFAAEAEA